MRILKNVFRKVGKFFIPVDFVVLDLEKDARVSITLERSFLATTKANIHAKNRRLTLKVGVILLNN